MPLGLDFPQRVVNVQWGGKAVAGSSWFGLDKSTYIYRLKSSKWEPILTFTPAQNIGLGNAVFASIAKDGPRFIVGTGFSDSGKTEIKMSKNTQDWVTVYSKSQAEVYGVCWDETEKAFYAAMTLREDGAQFDVLLRSPTGSGWLEVSRATYGSLPAGYQSPIILHGGNKVKDSNGNSVTNAFWGYNENSGILMYADPPYNYWGPPIGFDKLYGAKIVIKSPSGTTKKSLPGFGSIWAVAYGGGIWHAAGDSRSSNGDVSAKAIIATSTDNGVTWKTTFSGVAGTSIGSIAASRAAVTRAP
jgi:hypothetical protein